MRKKLIIGVVLAAVICTIGVVWYGYINRGSGSFNHMGGSSEIIVNKVREKSGGSIGVEVKEGEKIVIKSYLEKGSIKIKLGKQKTPQTGKETIGELLDLLNGKDIEQIVEGYNTYEFEVPEGSYYGFANILKKATGRVTITAENKHRLEQ